MNVGAVITAAGMSSRMGEFKPMLKIGSMSIAERIVATIKQAGIDQIVMITGHNAEDLERHLSHNGLVFLRNPDYAHTHMFDSAKIGIQYLAGKCERIILTPVDIPLFTAQTIKALLAAEADLACPVFKGEAGHPIIFSKTVAEHILHDSGENGIRGALGRSGAEMTYIEVKDEGILHDADTPSDYQNLLDFHNKQLARPVVSVTIARETPFLDSRTAKLMQLIDETKSVRTACSHLQLSYSSGWNIIRALETQMNCSIVSRSQGGSGGGGSELTEAGKDLLKRFTRYEAKIKKLADREFSECFKDYF